MTDTAIIVLGMHRSGTSAASGALACLGVSLGGRLYGAQEGVNEKGFWEHADIASTHDDVLRRIGSYWDDVMRLPAGWSDRPDLGDLVARLRHFVRRDFATTGLWGLKDPRMCRLLPVWSRVLAPLGMSATFLLVARDPLEVGRSLERRNGFSRDRSLLLWLLHNLEAEAASRGARRAVLTYDALLSEPLDAFRRVESELDISFPVPVEDAREPIGRFLSPGLRHHRSAQDTVHGALGAMCTRVYEEMRRGVDDARFHAAMDEVGEQLEAIEADRDPVLVEQLRDVARARGEYEQMFLDAYRSWWWRASWPMRSLERRIRQGPVRRELRRGG